MCFVTAGMGGGTGTGAAPVVARAAREKGILTVGVVTKPFHFEGQRRMKTADLGIEELQKCVDTLIVIPNQNLFRLANDKTTFADAFAMADQVLYSGVACITDLMVKEGLINLDFADVRSVMREMGKAMMGTGEASGEGRAMAAAEAAIANPLLDETSMRGAKGLLISITGGRDLTLFEVDEAATRIREEVDQDANIILGATFDEELEGVIRVSVVATGIDKTAAEIAAAPISIRQAPAKPAQPAAAACCAPDRRSACRADRGAARRRSGRRRHPPGRDQRRRHGCSLSAAAGRRLPARRASSSRQPQPAQPQQQKPQPAVAVAPSPEARLAAALQPQPAAAAPRMPQVEDFPPVVQAEVEAQAQPAGRARKSNGPMGLLKRLTTGLTRREEEPAKLQPAAAARAEAAPAGAGSAPHRRPGSAALRAAPRPARRARPARRRSRAAPRKTTSWRFRLSFAGKRTEAVQAAWPGAWQASRQAENRLRPPA